MSEPLRPLMHHESAEQDDEALAREARAHLARLPQLQLLAELLLKLRASAPPWWTPQGLRAAWGADTRMRWLRQRPDLRQRVTTALTGLPANAARKKSPEFQAELIDSVIDDGDVPLGRFEEAFDPCDLVVYGPAHELWREFRDRVPWEDDGPTQQRIVAWLIRALLSDRSPTLGFSRRPILTPWDVRSAIDVTAWHTRMPLEVRVAVDEARLKHEKTRPREPFHARHELGIALPEQIAASLPLAELAPVLRAAELAMGLDDDAERASEPAELFDAHPTCSGFSSAAPALGPVVSYPTPVVTQGAA